MKKLNHPTEYRKELRGRILEVAMQDFIQRGIRAVKMDDIAGSLGISKRTLYEIFPNKESLLLEGIRLKQAMGEEEMVKYVTEKNPNTMDIIMKFYHMQMEELSSLPLTFITEISRYPLVTDFLRKKHQKSEENANRFFQRGVKEGYFRSDVDYELISRFGEGMTQNAIARQLYFQYEPQYIFRNIIFLFLRGFCTQKGLEYI
ncbi:MAG: TetR/AcrR family transcriptional regulator, partial [Prevotella sp.]|nr:TetR/AcrR family transcriptional regulator [Prevotella sp.]